MKKKTAKTETGLGILPDDRAAVRHYLKRLGWTVLTLAQRSDLSRQMLTAWFAGDRNLSDAATTRIIAALQVGWWEMQAARKAIITPEVAAQIRARAWAEVESMKSSSDPKNPIANLLAIDDRQTILSASEELPLAKSWIERIEAERDTLKAEVASLKKINALSTEALDLYKSLVQRLKQQLLDAGITPAK